MDFKELNYILTIAEERSFSKAAGRLFLSQPSLSQYVKRLEQSLGFPLFKRSVIPLALTNEGSEYVEYARRILLLKEEMSRAMADIADSQRGGLVLGTSMARGTATLPGLIPFFKKAHPHIDVKLIERPPGESVNLEKLVYENKIDLCFLSPPIGRRDIHYEKLLDEPMLLAAPPDFRAEAKPNPSDPNGWRVVDLACVEDAHFILGMPHTRIRMIAEEECAKAGFAPRVTMESNSIETAQRMVAVGYGFTLVPELVISRWKDEARRPQYFAFGDPPYTWPLYIAYKKDAYMSKAARAFLGATREYFRDHIIPELYRRRTTSSDSAGGAEKNGAPVSEAP